MNWRQIISSLSNHILAKIPCLFLPNFPTIGLYIVKIDISTRITSIASNCIGIEETVMYSNIFYCYIPHSHSRFSLANSFTKGIEHTTRTISIWFFHLLRTYIDTPPNRSVHSKIFKVKIFNYACPLMTWIRLDINAFDWPYHPPISSCNISNTISTC